MDAIMFINRYHLFITEIESVIKPELLPILDELKEIDPHDLVRPDSCFLGAQDGRGFVWSLFIKKALYNSNFNQP